jgi:two-component system, NarL family, sensor kinase
MGTCYKLLDDVQKAEQCYRQALQYAEKQTRVKYTSSCYDALSTLAHRKGNYTMALALLDSARRAEVTTAFYNVAFKHANRMIAEGSIHLDMKNYDRAKLLLEKGHSDATKMQNNELLIEVKPSLAELYAATGQQEKAYRLMQEYTEMKDTLLKTEQARSVKVQTDVILGEKDRTMLAQKLEITSQKNILQQKNFIIGGTLLGSLLLSLLSFALARIYKNKQAVQQSLIQQLQQTQEINQLKAQVRGEEQERQRIAHELHDNISGQLWALKLNVDNMKQTGPHHEGYHRNLATIYKQLTDASQDVRKTAHNLLPDLLLQEGLATALASLCEKTSKHTRLEVDFQEYGDVPRTDKEIELSIYRMVQELIQNVLKHAYEATHILVQLSCVNNLLSITVEDNGKGPVEEQKEEGVGLQQIRKRTTALKGSFDFQSLPGNGTTAYLEFDLNKLL